MISQSRRSIFDYTLAMSTFAKECLEGVGSTFDVEVCDEMFNMVWREYAGPLLWRRDSRVVGGSVRGS